MLPLEDVWDSLRTLCDLRDPELLLLKGHLIVERVLVAAAASRLVTDDEVMRKFSFAKLLDLVFAPDQTQGRMYDHEIPIEHQRNVLSWLNQMRNFLAHEFNALEDKQFVELVGCFHLPWPRAPLERCLVLEAVVNQAHLLAHRRYLFYEYDAAAFKKADDNLDPLFDLWGAVCSLIKTEQWDDIVAVLRNDARPRPLSG